MFWYSSRLDSLSLQDTQKDPKTRLQEFLQSRQQALPKYDVVSVEGEAHEQTFYVECIIDMLKQKSAGSGSSRRIAEQKAARVALTALGLEE